MKPSNSTLASLGLGLPIAIILAWLASLAGIEMPGEVQTALGVVIGGAIGYFFDGGKAEQTVATLSKQSGHARLGMLAGILVLGALTACSLLGLPQAKTFNQKLTVGYSTVTELRSTATALLELRVIRAEDAQNVQATADTARTGLDLARALQATDQKAAEAKLRQAEIVLQSLRAYLRSRDP